MASVEELKARARAGDTEALRVLRERGFFARKGRAAGHPVSEAQRRLWVLDQMAPASAAYNIPGAIRLGGPLDEGAFERALQALVARHEALRTRFAMVDGEVRQMVEPDATVPLERVDLSRHRDPAAEARELIAAAAATPFALDTAPLVTAALYTLAPDDRVFAFVIHHIVADGWSLGVLFRELMALYEAFARGAASPLQPLRLQYKDVTAWQRRRLEEGAFDPARRFWLDRLSGELPVLEFPRDFPRSAVQSSAGAHVGRDVPADVVAGLERFGASCGATPFMTLLTAVRVFLFRYTGQDDAIVGTPVSGRSHPDLEHQVGFYVNLLPLRLKVTPGDTFRSALARVRDEARAAYAHDYPFDRLVDELDLRRDMSRSPLFDALMTLEEEPAAVAAPAGLRVEPFPFPVRSAKYDLTFFFTRARGTLSLSINYSTALFRQERMEKAAEHLLNLLKAIAASPDMPLVELPMADAGEIETITRRFGRSETEYPRDASIAEIFERQVASTPDAEAVVSESADGVITRLTYRELNERADRVAAALRSRGVTLETAVGVLLERGERVAVALLGILKAGGCYVPLETRAPADRLAFIVRDAGCQLVIDEQVLAGLEGGDAVSPSASHPRTGVPHGGTLAYVMYTSGSTGEPKGALIEHRAVLRLVLNNHFLPLGPDSRMLQTGSLAFDASTLEIWGPLLNGGTVCFAPGEDIIVSGRVRELIDRHRITAMWVTASLLNQLVDSGQDVFGSLQYLLTGGEALSPTHIGRLRRRYPNLVLVNGYGPTENTTFTACHHIEQVDAGDIPIGRPIANTSVFILDEEGRVCPIGVAGEIYAGGDGLARGYLNRPDLTAETFVAHPLAGDGRLYRTGDIGRWRWDGVIEFLGRRDLQVKVRGYRIEPGEIEAQLLQHPLINTACVIARSAGDGTKELVAYYTGGVEPGAVREHLAARVPPYMVPAHLVPLEVLPLNRNGKVDRARLPAPESVIDRQSSYVAPRTPLEQTLCDIWRDVLQAGEVGVRDNFFELGGHSLKATRVLTRIHREISDRVTLRDLFAAPDIASLAARIEAMPGSRSAAIPRASLDGPVPASHAQRRLWLLQQLSGDTGAYNVPGAVLIEGALDAARLSAAFSRLVTRHESLRTTFAELDGELCQIVSEPFAVEIPVRDLSAAADPESEARRLAAALAADPFTLTEGPLFRAALFRLAPERHVFFFNLHHIITDGWSMRVLLGELMQAYGDLATGAGDSLPPLPLQYRDYAVWQRQQLESPEGQAHRQYWLDRFRDEVAPLELPSDRPRPAVQTFRGGVVRTSLDAETVEGLRRLGRQHGATFYTVLLSLVRVLLFRHSGQDEFVIGTGVSGREHADLNGQVGFYVNMLPLRQRVSGRSAFVELLQQTRDTVAEALEHQSYPFDLLVADLDLRREAGRQPLFDIVVTLEEDEDAAGPAKPDAGGLKLSTFELPAPFSKFDLMFAFSNSGGRCGVVLEYSSDLFDADRIARLSGQLSQLVASVLADPTGAIGEIEILPERERRQLARFAAAPSPYPADQDVGSLFDRQAAATPDAIAVVSGESRLTYATLQERADAVAMALRARGVDFEDRVGVRLDRSERMVIALLGILKAGGAYVPLEINAPAERIDFMVADAGCRLVIDEETFRLLEEEGRTLDPSHLRSPAPSHPRNLAYVMYTSGSTGQPKGTLIEHRSIVRLVIGANYLQLGPGDRMLQTGSIAFDASTLEIWGPLLNGGTVCFAPSDVLLDAGRMRAAIRAHGITAMFVTTSLFNQLVDGDPDVFAGLRCLMTGGEKVSVGHINTVISRHPGLALLHVYGPTENTTFTTWYRVEKPHTLDVPIGGPLANTTVYVLDSLGGLAPIGVPGEICTGGDGLARGYLNRPALTAERFVPMAFDPDGRVYRTGDIGRWRADGAIEFIGRRDNQVKVHGYRVEPGEIEARMLQHPAITQAAVLARRTTVGTQELVAYYSADDAEGTSGAEVRAFLAASLPPYMVPSEFIRLAALPLNQNGKIDRRKLLTIQAGAEPASVDEGEPPQTVEEKALAEVWCAVLDRPRVSRDDHYFDAGGDSIRAIQIVNRLRKAGWNFDVRDVFQYPVLRDAATQLTRAVPAETSTTASGPVPLTPIQRWFFTRRGERHHFNHAVLLRAGTMREDALRASIRALVAHHAALRLVVAMDETGQPTSMVDRGPDIADACVDVRDVREASDEAWQQDMNAVQRGFDLTTGPLFKAVLYRRADGARLLLVAHHLIIDGVSWRILLEDLEQAYAAAEAGSTPQLTPQVHSYAEWARAVAATSVPSLPTAYSLLPAEEEFAAGATYGDCDFVEVTLSADSTHALLREVHSAFGTGMDDLLLAALSRVLPRDEDGAWVAMEGHGRDAVPGLDVGAAIGWFTSVFGVQLPPVPSDRRQQIRQVKEALRAARRDKAEPPASCRISVNYMGQVDEQAARGGRFSLAPESCGNPISPTLERSHALELGGVVRNGQLTLSLTFSRALTAEAEARRLLDDLSGELHALIAACRGAAAEKTPSDFTACPLSLEQYDALLAANGWHPGAVEDVYPLTPMQEGLLFQSLLDTESRAYFLQLNYRMLGPLDVDRFRMAWHEVARRHASLRAAIVHDDVDRPLQVILADRRPTIRIEDLSDVPPAERAAALARAREEDMARGVDLQREPLMRMVVLRLGEHEHHVIWSYHHVLLDGWSLGILYREFQEIYRGLGGEAPIALPPPQRFANYMRWLAGQDPEAARAHWTSQLEEFTPTLLVDQLAADPGGSGDYTLQLDRELTRRLMQVATTAGVTLNTVVQALWALLVARYTGSHDVAFGAVVSGRPSSLPGVEDMVGLFINTVPVRARLEPSEPFSGLLRRMQREAVAAEPFHFFPLAEVQALHGGGTLFDHLLVFENYPIGSGGGEADPDALRVEAFEAHDRTHYDLDLTIVPGETLQVRFSYRPDRVSAGAVERLAAQLARLAESAVASPDAPALSLDLLPADERATLLDVGRGPEIAYPVERSIGELFEAQAKATPDAIAIRHRGVSLTYAQLDARSNQVAHWLRSRGVGHGDFVGLQLRRGIDLLAAMLGVLKAGGAFVPIDPDYPEDRIRFMREDSGARAVIDALPPDVDVQPAAAVPRVSTPRSIAYMLYTSGSTGRPKGAQVRHDGAVNHIFAEFELLRFHPGSAFLQSAPSSSDISVWQFLAPVLIGGRAVVADYEDVADPARLFALMKSEGITICELVPVVMQGLLDHAAGLDPADRALPALECAMVTGETVPVPLVNQWLAAYPHVPLINAYGPTEAADDICQAVLRQPLPPDAPTVPIGRPLANLRLYVLDSAQQLVPFGATGEICVSGIGVGAGYWRDAAKTAAAFVANPYADGDPHHAVLYRTGDRGRWRADGELECLGRLDQQVKIRGFRVELEEIEHRLLEHAGVRHAIAGIRTPGGEPALVAWIVGDASASELRDHLRERVPAHMIPAHFVAIDELPLTPAGKVDRRALPMPDAASDDDARTQEPPATPLERQIAAIWCQVLQRPSVGRHESFFDLGGHSLKAMQVVSRMHRDLNVRVSLPELFAEPTVAALAALIEKSAAAGFESIPPAESQPYYELSHAQKRLWLLHHLEGQVAYNMPEAVILDEPVDRGALRQAFAALVARHEALRTAFVLIDGQPRQQILESMTLSIREEDLTGFGSEEEASAEAARRAAAEAAVPFDLSKPPLLRAVLYRLTPTREVFLMVIHHIIGDGWSMNVLYREVLALYDAFRHGRPNPLPPLGIQYKDFAAWQNRQDMRAHEEYWLAALAGSPDRLELPYDTQVQGDRDFSGSTEDARIDRDTVRKLQALAGARGTTLSNVVLAVFQLFLYQWTRQPDICVGLAIANRNRPELENLIGFFVNILPVRVQVSPDMEFADLLALVHARTTEAFEHQDYPFDLLVERLNPARQGNRQAVLNVIYAFQNFEDVAIDLGGSNAQPPAPDSQGGDKDREKELVKPFKVPFETSKFDLTLFVTEMAGELVLSLEYDTRLFRRETIRRAVTTIARFARMAG